MGHIGGLQHSAGVAVKMVSSQPAGKQSLLKSSHGLEKVGSRRRRGNDKEGEEEAKERGNFGGL